MNHEISCKSWDTRNIHKVTDNPRRSEAYGQINNHPCEVQLSQEQTNKKTS